MLMNEHTQDGGFPGVVQSQNEHPHLSVANEAGEHLGEQPAHAAGRALPTVGVFLFWQSGAQKRLGAHSF